MTFALDHVKLSTVHRIRSWSKNEHREEHRQRKRSLANAMLPDKECPAILLQGYIYVATQWMSGAFPMKRPFQKGEWDRAEDFIFVVEKNSGHH